MAFIIEVRSATGWAGGPAVGGWVPAIDGTLNQTSDSAVDASTFDDEEQANEIARTLVADQNPDEWRIREVDDPEEVRGRGEEGARMSEIKVGKWVREFESGADDEEDAGERQWTRYGAVHVTLPDGYGATVGVCIGVQPYMRGTATAAGAGIRPYLTVWYVESSDWSTYLRDGDDSDEVLAAIADEQLRLAEESGLFGSTSS